MTDKPREQRSPRRPRCTAGYDGAYHPVRSGVRHGGRAHTRGVTLTELMVAVFIIGVSAAVAVAMSRSTNTAAYSYAQQIYSELNRARNNAMSSGYLYKVEFTTTGVNTWLRDTSDSTATWPTLPQRTYPLPPHVAIWGITDSQTSYPTGTSPPAIANTWIVFDGTGTLNTDDADATNDSRISGTQKTTFFIHIASTNVVSGAPQGKNALYVQMNGTVSNSSWE